MDVVLKNDTARHRCPYASVQYLKLDSFEALKAVILKFPVLGDVTPCSYRRFERSFLPSPSRSTSLESSD
jgi:hypothetical protein